jgi:ADP-ribose pyrophosphatase YjhB (NUDIX family)
MSEETSFAAGILIYTIFNGDIYFLLGLETSNNKWSAFVGGSEIGEIPQMTAYREFHEETANVFKNRNIKLVQNNVIIDKTPSGKNVYIWYTEMKNVDFNINEKFLRNKKILSEKKYQEKKIIEWVHIDDLKMYSLLNSFKRVLTKLPPIQTT